MAEMKPVWWMAGLSIVSAFVFSAVLANVEDTVPVSLFSAEIWLGMLAPLLVVSASWIFAARTYTRHPDRLTAVMMTGFAGKLVLFGAYFGVAIGVWHVRAVPFAASFAAYFIALHMAEAVCLQRLFAERMRAA
jgi:hypothetical protein